MELAIGAAAVGLIVVVAALVLNRRSGGAAVEELIGMTPWSPPLAEVDDDAELSQLTGRAVALADEMVTRIGRNRSLSAALQRAQIPLRPGEFLIVVLAGALGSAALALVVTHSSLLSAAGAVFFLLLAVQFIRRRAVKRRRAIEAQLPDALALVASSLSAGHTFLRAIQMMCEESSPPLSEEFERVLAETRLGDPTADALARMAERVQVRDFDMVVQAIRIQQTIGGRLADLLHTLADFIRARDEVRREVKVLTAEGRMSAYVLAGLVPFLYLMIQLLNPGYVKPMYHGWGLAMLCGCGASLLVGIGVILRMVKIDV